MPLCRSARNNATFSLCGNPKCILIPGHGSARSRGPRFSPGPDDLNSRVVVFRPVYYVNRMARHPILPSTFRHCKGCHFHGENCFFQLRFLNRVQPIYLFKSFFFSLVFTRACASDRTFVNLKCFEIDFNVNYFVIDNSNSKNNNNWQSRLLSCSCTNINHSIQRKL